MSNVFEWKTNFGNVKPDLGIALGLLYIKEHLKEAGLKRYNAYWDDEGKAFVIVGHLKGKAPLASAIIFNDLETLQNGSPEALADLFESRVMNTVNSVELALLGKIETTSHATNNPKAVTGASQGSTPQA
jgi:hypothetical protein